MKLYPEIKYGTVDICRFSTCTYTDYYCTVHCTIRWGGKPSTTVPSGGGQQTTSAGPDTPCTRHNGHIAHRVAPTAPDPAPADTSARTRSSGTHGGGFALRETNGEAPPPPPAPTPPPPQTQTGCKGGSCCCCRPGCCLRVVLAAAADTRTQWP